MLFAAARKIVSSAIRCGRGIDETDGVNVDELLDHSLLVGPSGTRRAEGVAGRRSEFLVTQGWLGQWKPTMSAMKSGRVRLTRAMSSVQAAIARIQLSYCSRAAGISPFQPWLITNTSVMGSRARAALIASLIFHRIVAAFVSVGVEGN